MPRFRRFRNRRRRRVIRRRRARFPLSNTRSRQPGKRGTPNVVRAQFIVSDPATNVLLQRNGDGKYTAVTIACVANNPAAFLSFPFGQDGNSPAWNANHKPRGWDAVAQDYKFYRVEKCMVVDEFHFTDQYPVVTEMPSTALNTNTFPKATFQVNTQKSQRAFVTENQPVNPGQDNAFRFYYRELPKRWSKTKTCEGGQKLKMVTVWSRKRDIVGEPQKYDKITSWDPLYSGTSPIVPGSGVSTVAPRGPAYIPSGNSLQQGNAGDGNCYIWTHVQMTHCDEKISVATGYFQVVLVRKVYYTVSFKDYKQPFLQDNDLWDALPEVTFTHDADDVHDEDKPTVADFPS